MIKTPTYQEHFLGAFLSAFGGGVHVEAEGEREPVLLSDLKIRTKDQRLVTLVPNETQEYYLDLLAASYPPFDWRNGNYTLRGIREDFLKFRQPGISTIIEALYFLDTVNNPYTQTVVIAHDPDTTQLLFQIMHRYFRHLPAHKKPRPKRDTVAGMLWFDDLDSLIYVGKIGVREYGRGGTINNLHMSERAYWPGHGNSVEAGLLQAVPAQGNVSRETTANGYNDYYRQYKEAERGEGGQYLARFAPWTMHGEYEKEPPADFEMTAEEAELARTYHDLSPRKLAWRRDKKAELDRLKKSFEQEYPLNSTEAFMSGGDNAKFNRKFLHTLHARLIQPENKPSLTMEPGEYGVAGHVKFYRQPEAGMTYMVICDPAEGLSKDKEHDSTSMDVLCVETWEQCCHYHGQMDTAECAKDAVWLCQLYNEALLVTEVPGPGGAVLVAAMHVYNYGHVYKHQDFGDASDPVWKPGWRASTKTKREKDDFLEAQINDLARGDEGLIIRDPDTVEELITYVKLPGGGCGGEGTAHDDRVSSLSIGYWMLFKGEAVKGREREEYVQRPADVRFGPQPRWTPERMQER